MLAAVLLAPVTALGSAPPAAATATREDHRLLVDHYYEDLLRGYDSPQVDPGSSYWVDQLDAGVPRQQVAEALLRSQERAEADVRELYRRYLDRDSARDPGSRYWSEGIRAGMEREWVEQNLLASPELARRVTDRQLVGLMYAHVVGRYDDRTDPPGPGYTEAEVQYWLDRLRELRGDRLRWVRELWYSDEAVRGRIADKYVGLLGRGASEGELAYWSGPQVRSDRRTLSAFVATSEYQDAIERLEAFRDGAAP